MPDLGVQQHAVSSQPSTTYSQALRQIEDENMDDLKANDPCVTSCPERGCWDAIPDMLSETLSRLLSLRLATLTSGTGPPIFELNHAICAEITAMKLLGHARAHRWPETLDVLALACMLERLKPRILDLVRGPQTSVAMWQLHQEHHSLSRIAALWGQGARGAMELVPVMKTARVGL